MRPLPDLVVTEHIRDLVRDADAHRLAAELAASTRSRSAWRRAGGAAARRLSAALEEIASELDPAVCLPSYGRE